MTHSLLVVEGAHDASFFGHLLRAKRYRRAVTLPELPPFWEPFVPRRYPVSADQRLDRVIRFPDVFSDAAGNTVGILAAGGDASLVTSLRTALEQLGVDRFLGIGIALDTDFNRNILDRFNAFVASLEALNNSAREEGVPGFPLTLPTAPGMVTSGFPKLGVHLFPDNERQGTLETVLIEHAHIEHPLLTRAAATLVGYVDRKSPVDPSPLARLRKTSGRIKAQAGIVASILHPGASLAVSIHDGDWRVGKTDGTASIRAATRFLEAITT